MSKATHEADLRAAAEIAGASEFSVFRQFGPGERFCRRGIPSIHDAVALADAIDAKNPSGRRSLVYAIVRQNGSEHDQPIGAELRAKISAELRAEK